MRFSTVFALSASASAQILSLGGTVDSGLSIEDAPPVSSIVPSLTATAGLNATVPDASTAAASAVASAALPSILRKRHGPDDDEEEEAAAALSANATAAIIVATPPIAINTEALAAVALGKRQDVGGVYTETTGTGINSCGSFKEGEQGEGDPNALSCEDPPPPEGVPTNQPSSTAAPQPTPTPANPNNGQNGQNGNSNGQGNQPQGNQGQPQDNNNSNNNNNRPDRDDRPNRGGRDDYRPRPAPRPRPRPQQQQPPRQGGGLLGLNIGGSRGGLLGGGGLLGTGLILRRDTPSAKFYHMLQN